MLTLSDATQILGGNVSSSQNGTVPSGQSTAFTMCQYSSLDMNRSLNLLVRQSSSAEEAAAIYGQAKKNAPIMSGIAVQDVPGLGDGAFWIADGFSQLNILYKDRWIMISVLGLQSDDRLGLARAAAARMLQRL